MSERMFDDDDGFFKPFCARGADEIFAQEFRSESSAKAPTDKPPARHRE